ncbi:nascent polypeptide-associated complex subunit alpha [Drosophila novamexicana]|uniref:nascent polypeptide-associated complex subunit alpha n=1 Tax=Drosophila novamexicana TaxID=47314 RepID=UPI0011E5F3FD|nr:nascent polypeptide-associated complex subunit alpha [Drosophila novamexicana]
MGKKQKMKKAAAAAKAAASVAAQSAPAVEANSSSSNNNNNNNNNKNNSKNKNKSDESNQKPDIRAIYNNMQNLMSLAENLQTLPSGTRKNQPSSGSGSSASDSSDSDDAPDPAPSEEEQAAAGGVGQSAPQRQQKLSTDVPAELLSAPKYSRGEKKARRLLMKLDLEPVANVSRVTMRKAKNVLLCIDQPEVYKCPNSKTLICFGEVRIENTSNAAAAQAAERYINDVNVRAPQLVNDARDPLLATNEDEDVDVDIDALGNALDEKDIELVQMQAGCTRQTAIKALIKHKSDVVNAIMELTVGVDI